MRQDTHTADRPIRLHAFALISAIGWLIDFTIFNLLALVGIAVFYANLTSAGVAVTLVFVAGRRFIFRESRTPLPVAVACYVAWNIVAILAASYAIVLIGRLLATPVFFDGWRAIAGVFGISLDAALLVAPSAKLLVTPFTMYFNYIAMGIIIERRLRLW